MGEQVVVCQRQGPVAVITMNRPEYRNAQNSAMTYALDEGFTRAVEDDEVKVIVLTGAGKHFSAGHDIGTPDRDMDSHFDNKAVMWWDHPGKRGGDSRYARESEVYPGMCRRWRDIVASDDAFFSDPVVRMGIPGVEYFAHPWMLSPRVAKEILFTGDRFGAARAKEWGMVNRVVPRGDLAAETLAPAHRIAEMPSFGLALAKKAVNQAEDLMGMRAGMDSAFGLHHFAHAHNVEIGGDSLGGHNATTMANSARKDV